jgi:hypothetical protein
MINVDWTAEELDVLSRLDTPEAIQDFLDTMPYNDEITCRSPRRVLRDRKGHCMEGALFAAAALERIGQPPVLVDMRAEHDDDHILALFRRDGLLGAVAKSNYTGLRYRSPVYRSLRELVLSYFEDYFNPWGELTLRGYTRPLHLRSRRFGQWRTREDDLDDIGEHMDTLPVRVLISPERATRLRRVPEQLMAAGLLGANPRGLYGAH